MTFRAFACVAALGFVTAVPPAQSPAPAPQPNACASDPGRPAAPYLCRAARAIQQFKPELKRRRDNDRWLELAISELKSAISVSNGTPDFAVAVQWLIDLYAPAYLNDPAKAEPLIRQWIEAHPSDLRPRMELAAISDSYQTIEPSPLSGIKQLSDPRSLETLQLAALRNKWRRPQAAQGTTLKPVGNTKAPTLVRSVQPVYPEISRMAGVEGTVMVEVRISEVGRVLDAKVVRSIPLLDQAALDAVRKWEFKPTVVNGRTIPVTSTVSVEFKLVPK